MSPISLGDAEVTLKLGGTEAFKADLIAQVAAAIKAAEAQSVTPSVGGKGGSGDGGAAAAAAAAVAAAKLRRDAEADAERSIRQGLDETGDSADGLSQKLTTVSKTLSQLGVTGQARMIALAGSIGFPIVVLGAFVTAAAAAAAAVTDIGVKGGDALRSATLGFESVGLSAQQAVIQVKALQALSSQGLTFANLDTDTGILLQLGIAAKNTTPILTDLANAFAKSGDVGAQLQTDVDAATKALQSLAATASITSGTFAKSVKSLNLGVTATDAFKELQAELGVTSSQLDALLAKGKVTGSQLAGAAVNAAAVGSAGALQNAVNTSPTQALTALKDSATQVLASAFGPGNSALAGAINGVSTQLNTFLSQFGPKIAALLPGVVASLSKALPAIGTALVDSLQLVKPLLDSIAPIVAGLAKDVSDFFQQANTQGSQTQQFLVGLRDVFQELGLVIGALVPFIENLARGLGGFIEELGQAKPVIQAVASGLSAIANSTVGKFLLEVSGYALTVYGSFRLFTAITTPLIVALESLAAKLALGALGEGALATSAGIATTAVGGLSGALASVGSVAAIAFGAFLIGDKITQAIGGHFIGTSKAAQQLNDVLKETVQDNPALAKSFDDAGLSVEDLADSFGAYDKAIASGTSTSAAIIGQLEGVGLSSYQTKSALEALGVSATNAQDAMLGISTSAADAQLAALGDTALQAAGSLAVAGAQAQAAYSALNGGTFGPITQAQGAAALAGNAQPAAISIPKISIPKISIPNAASLGGSSAAKQAAKTLADATASFKTALTGFETAIGGSQTVAAVDSAFATLQSALDTEDKALGKKEPSGLATYLAKQKTSLEKSASELALAITTRASFLDNATVAAANPNVAGAQGIILQLQGTVARATQFAADLKKLQSSGLNQTALQQLLAVGPTSAGLQAADDLVHATSAQIGQINSLQTQAGLTGDALGTSLASNFKDAGTQAAAGLIDGLASSEPAISKAMSKLAATMTTTFKKDLGIHSPSTVFEQHGLNVIAGLNKGLGTEGSTVPIPGLGKAGAGAAGPSVVFGPGSIVVNGLKPDEAQETGTILAGAISATLTARTLATALAS